MTVLAENHLGDRFGFFTDEAQTTLNGTVIAELAKAAGESIKGFSKKLSLNRTQIYGTPKVNVVVRERLRDLARIADNAYDVSNGNMASIRKWLITPNRSFYNMSPFEMAMAGKGKSVYESQERLIRG